MRQDLPAEIAIIVQALDDHDDPFPSRLDKAEYIWDSLKDHWKDNMDPRNIEKTKPVNEIEWSSQYFDGTGPSIPTFKVPGLDDIDDIEIPDPEKLQRQLDRARDELKSFALDQVEKLYEEVLGLSMLSCWDKKQKKAFDKILERLNNFDYA